MVLTLGALKIIVLKSLNQLWNELTEILVLNCIFCTATAIQSSEAYSQVPLHSKIQWAPIFWPALSTKLSFTLLEFVIEARYINN